MWAAREVGRWALLGLREEDDMNDDDRAALDAWKNYRAAIQMADWYDDIAGDHERRACAVRIAQKCFDAWIDALEKARRDDDVAWLNGAR